MISFTHLMNVHNDEYVYLIVPCVYDRMESDKQREYDLVKINEGCKRENKSEIQQLFIKGFNRFYSATKSISYCNSAYLK